MARFEPDITPPACKGQHDTKQYAESKPKTLNVKGGQICVPKFKGWGGTLKYPSFSGSLSATLISSTTAYQPSFFPNTNALFYIQFKPSSAIKFGGTLSGGASLAYAKLKINKPYTIGGADYYGSLFRALPYCYTRATKGKYGPMIGGLGYPLKNSQVHYAFVFVFAGKSATTKC